VTGQARDAVIQRQLVAPGLTIRRFAREKCSKIGEPLALQWPIMRSTDGLITLEALAIPAALAGLEKSLLECRILM
jgi:hypothetical protein